MINYMLQQFVIKNHLSRVLMFNMLTVYVNHLIFDVFLFQFIEEL